VAQLKRPVTGDDRHRVAELHAQGLSRNAIAVEIGRSGRTVSRICAEQDPPLTFERTRTAAATATTGRSPPSRPAFPANRPPRRSYAALHRALGDPPSTHTGPDKVRAHEAPGQAGWTCVVRRRSIGLGSAAVLRSCTNSPAVNDRTLFASSSDTPRRMVREFSILRRSRPLARGRYQVFTQLAAGESRIVLQLLPNADQ